MIALGLLVEIGRLFAIRLVFNHILGFLILRTLKLLFLILGV